MHLRTAMSPVGAGSPISKTSKRRCSSASRLISRSGSIRELNELIFAKLALAGFSGKPQVVNFANNILRALRRSPAGLTRPEINGDVCYGKTPRTQVDLALSRTIANSHR